MIRLEVVTRRSSYGAYKVALLEVNDDTPTDRLWIRATKTSTPLIVRVVHQFRLKRTQERMEVAKQRLQAMNLETLFFHKRCGFPFAKLLPDARYKQDQWETIYE